MELKLTPELLFLVKQNLLFIDPIRRVVKPQSTLDSLAIRKALNR
jgi:AAA+ ATPase superfamily predicted ATPase